MTGRVFLHVGLPKTGTTFLQSVLWRQRDLARRQGLLLPANSVHDHFRAALDIRESAHLHPEPARVIGSWHRLVEEAGTWDQDALISHELLVFATEAQARLGAASLQATGKEVHLVITARDMARQLPAEWQERLKARSMLRFDGFVDHLKQSDDPHASSFWAAQDVGAVIRRWAADLPSGHVHLVTVPAPGSPPSELWRRFAGLLGLDPAAFDLSHRRPNASLGAEQAELLRLVNLQLGDRLPRPGPYPAIVKSVLANEVLARQPGERIILAGDDLEFARRTSESMVRELSSLDLDVVGDLDDLIVKDEPRPGETSTGRMDVPVDRLLAESLEAVVRLLDHHRVREQETRLQRRAAVKRVRDQTLAEAARRATASRELGVRDRIRQAVRRRSAADPVPSTGPRIVFLVYNAGGIGGVARTTLNIANALAATGTRRVEVVSVYRARRRPVFHVDDRVKLTYLVDASPHASRRSYAPSDAELGSIPSALAIHSDEYSALSDRALRRALSELEAGDVVVSTRPSLHVASAALAPAHAVRIGWDHLNFTTRYAGSGYTGSLIDRAMPLLDGYVVLTEEDARDYRERHPGTRVDVVRNALPWQAEPHRSSAREKVIVGAGRLSDAKGFDLLVEAWRRLGDEFPNWGCRIYGSGPLRDDLRRQIAAAGVDVELAGYAEDVRPVFRTASALVMSSRVEGFGMTLIEAMSQGTPVVSFDCPRGPGEIVVDGSNGLLVPALDVEGLTKAMRELMSDDDRRDRMGRQALEDSRQYEVEAIAAQWAALIEDVRAARRGG